MELLLRFHDMRAMADRSLLCHEDLSPLMKFQFSAVLQCCLVALGLGDFKVSAHSFHISAATEVAQFR